MQIHSINNQNVNIGFNGLYKIPANNIGEKVLSLVEEYQCLHIPSSDLANKYWYILTPENTEAEQKFEEAFLEEPGKYWKVDIKKTLSRDICKSLFDRRKMLDGYEERWVINEQHKLDVQS